MRRYITIYNPDTELSQIAFRDQNDPIEEFCIDTDYPPMPIHGARRVVEALNFQVTMMNSR